MPESPIQTHSEANRPQNRWIRWFSAYHITSSDESNVPTTTYNNLTRFWRRNFAIYPDRRESTATASVNDDASREMEAQNSVSANQHALDVIHIVANYQHRRRLRLLSVSKSTLRFMMLVNVVNILLGVTLIFLSMNSDLIPSTLPSPTVAFGTGKSSDDSSTGGLKNNFFNTAFQYGSDDLGGDNKFLSTNSSVGRWRKNYTPFGSPTGYRLINLTETEQEQMYRIGLNIVFITPLKTFVDSRAMKGLLIWRRSYMFPWLVLYGILTVIFGCKAVLGAAYYGFRWSYVLLTAIAFVLYTSWRHIFSQYSDMSLPQPNPSAQVNLDLPISSMGGVNSPSLPDSFQCSSTGRGRSGAADLPPKYEDLELNSIRVSVSDSNIPATTTTANVDEGEARGGGGSIISDSSTTSLPPNYQEAIGQQSTPRVVVVNSSQSDE